MNKTTALTAPSGIKAQAIVIFGRDGAGKPHASKFLPADRDAVVKAAALMDFRALNVADDGIAELTKALPDGKIFESGKCFVPFVKLDLCTQIERYADANPEQVAVYDGPLDASADVQAADARDTVTDATADDLTRPADWHSFTVGSVVLAVDVPEDGWWEAEVTHVHESGTKAKSIPMLTLRWRMWPDDGTIIRRFDHVALIHPSQSPDGDDTGDAPADNT